MINIESDCKNQEVHEPYLCATCNVQVCNDCKHIHRDYWANESDQKSRSLENYFE